MEIVSILLVDITNYGIFVIHRVNGFERCRYLLHFRIFTWLLLSVHPSTSDTARGTLIEIWTQDLTLWGRSYSLPTKWLIKKECDLKRGFSETKIWNCHLHSIKFFLLPGIRHLKDKTILSFWVIKIATL